MFISIISCLITYVCVLLGVAFFTLLERKGLRYIQIRKGPNKVGLIGLPQPFADALKLLRKEIAKPLISNFWPYLGAPVISLFLALLLWQLYPSVRGVNYFTWGIMYFLCVSSLNVYSTLLAGWSSNSKYALLGRLRGIAQTISYEVRIVLIFLFPLYIISSFRFVEIKESQRYLWLILVIMPVILIWFVTCVAETNRAPFDFAEGESELVSGFNIEYRSYGFVLLFLAEYANIIVMRLFTALLFIGANYFGGYSRDLIFILKVFFVIFLFVWVRGRYPRFRYDLLIQLTWKTFLPISLCLLILILSLCYIFFF